MKAVKIAKFRKENQANKKQDKVKTYPRVNMKERNLEKDYFDSFYDFN